MIVGPECRTCKWCIGTVEQDGNRYYICNVDKELNMIEDFFAEDPRLDCDGYEHDKLDGTTEKS